MMKPKQKVKDDRLATGTVPRYVKSGLLSTPNRTSPMVPVKAVSSPMVPATAVPSKPDKVKTFGAVLNPATPIDPVRPSKSGMAKTGYAKGGVVKANCGASMKPTQKWNKK